MVKDLFDKAVSASLRVKTGVAVAGASAASLMLPVLAYAADGDASSAATEAVGVVSAAAGLFTTYPMNIFLGFGITAGAIGLFARAKSASGGRR